MPKTEYVMVDTSTIPHPAEKHKQKFMVFGVRPNLMLYKCAYSIFKLQIIQIVASIICIGIGVYGAVKTVRGVEDQRQMLDYVNPETEEYYDGQMAELFQEPQPIASEYLTVAVSIFAGIMVGVFNHL